MNPNHLGMVEQIVCANAHTFIGTPLSTFTGFITRMRGFMNRTTVAALPPAAVPVAGTAPTAAPTGGGKAGNGKGKGKAKGKKQGLDLDVPPPKHTGLPVVTLPPAAAPYIGRAVPVTALLPYTAAPSVPVSSGDGVNGDVVAVGLYERTFYFMKKFTYQLHDRPHLELPFWVREFSEPFEDTEEADAQ
jgi:hypothetical protein